MEDGFPGKRQRLRLGPACDEHLAFLQEHGFGWEPWQPGPVMFGECWEASSSAAAITVCVDRRDGDFSVSIGPPGHRGLDLDVVADRLGVTKGERPRLSAKTKGAEAKRVKELAGVPAWPRGTACPGRLLCGSGPAWALTWVGAVPRGRGTTAERPDLLGDWVLVTLVAARHKPLAAVAVPA